MGKSAAKTYTKIIGDKVPFEDVRKKLKVKHLETKDAFSKKYPHAEKFFQEKGMELGKVRGHSAKIIGAGAITGALLVSPPTSVKPISLPSDLLTSSKGKVVNIADSTMKAQMVNTIKTLLPTKTRALTNAEEVSLEKTFKEMLGINAKATLEGEHLNTTYGRIGAEQHLKRFPGDSLAGHSDDPEMLKEGIAPGLGAWGYFAYSKDKMTKELEDTEKWYSVVQTLYLPDWNTRQPHLRNWYKHRKVLIVNTLNGNAVVTRIADAGPAAWTGKHYGGSPEVMHHLGGPRYKKGPVILFFVDDPENTVPLGPVDYNKVPTSLLAKI